MENVDWYFIRREGDEVVIEFTDIFEDGEEIRLPLQDACQFTVDLIRLLRS